MTGEISYTVEFFFFTLMVYVIVFWQVSGLIESFHAHVLSYALIPCV